jgi:hypothetical protein
MHPDTRGSGRRHRFYGGLSYGRLQRYGHYPVSEEELPTFGIKPYLMFAGPKRDWPYWGMCSLHAEEGGPNLFYKVYSPQADAFEIEFGYMWAVADYSGCYRYSSAERVWKCFGKLC